MFVRRIYIVIVTWNVHHLHVVYKVLYHVCEVIHESTSLLGIESEARGSTYGRISLDVMMPTVVSDGSKWQSRINALNLNHNRANSTTMIIPSHQFLVSYSYLPCMQFQMIPIRSPSSPLIVEEMCQPY